MTANYIYMTSYNELIHGDRTTIQRYIHTYIHTYIAIQLYIVTNYEQLITHHLTMILYMVVGSP